MRPQRFRSQATNPYIETMATVHIPYTVERDEDGAWCAHAVFVTADVHGGANGAGDTQESAITDLHEALAAMVEEFGLPA